MTISSKSEYIYYLLADELALDIPKEGISRLYARILRNNWRYQRLLRKTEYRKNCSKTFIGKLYAKWLSFRLLMFGDILGYSIPVNVCGPGLGLMHVGPIIINGNVKIGKNFRCQSMVNIGRNERVGIYDQSEVPTIGDNVVVMPGVKIFGKISIANNIVVGANAVVNKSFLEEGVTIGGIPAKIISYKSSKSIIPGNPAEEAFTQIFEGGT